MRKRWTSTLVLGTALVILCAGLAIAAPTKTIVGNLEFIADGGFSPKGLPKNKLAAIHLRVSGEINTLDHTHVPPLKEVTIETDKNGMINAKGLPACKVSKIAATTTRAALKACRPALVGKGKTDVEIEFAESPHFPVSSELLAFNGGVKGGTTTILIHAFLKNPVSAAVITTVKVSKIHRGRYGTKSVATIPVIAGGAGSVKKFELEIFREFTHKGTRQSYLLAKCPDGKLQAHAEAVFATGDKLAANFVRSCTPKG